MRGLLGEARKQRKRGGRPAAAGGQAEQPASPRAQCHSAATHRYGEHPVAGGQLPAAPAAAVGVLQLHGCLPLAAAHGVLDQSASALLLGMV